MDLKKKIIIVEDNDVYRAALKGLINAQDHLEVAAEAGSGADAIEIIARYPADLVLLDLRLPEASGYDVLPEISKSTDAKILVLTILESDHNIRAAFDAGADGYCFKDVSSQELLDAISRVLAGEQYVSRPALSYPEERRAEHRQACDCNIVWAFFNKDNLGSARMLNCSRAGCYFETPQHITTGSTVLIRLEKCAPMYEHNGTEFVRANAVAEVKWCDKWNNQYGVGARYHIRSN